MTKIKNHDEKLAAAFVRSVFDYNPNTGDLIWRKARPHVKAGSVAGGLNKGYVQIGLCDELFRAHRLVWLYHYGKWPTQEIDHINGIKSDNRIENLRDVSHHVNTIHRKSYAKSGRLGVTFDGGRWRARITDSYGATHSLGYFDTREEASDAYKTAHAKIHLLDSDYFDTHYQPNRKIIQAMKGNDKTE